MRSLLFSCFLVPLLLLQCARLATAQKASFDVINQPTQGSVLYFGSEFKIGWTPSLPAHKITIKLLGGPSEATQNVFATIASNINSSTGSYKWSIMQDLLRFDTYGLQIVNVSDVTIFQYSYPFVIRDKASSSSSSSTAEATSTSSTTPSQVTTTITSLPSTADAALTSPTASPSSSSSSAADTGLSTGLSTGAKAGIGAGAGVAALALLVGLLLFFLRRRRSGSRGSAAHELPGGWGAEQKTRIELESARQAAELDSPQSFIAVPVDYSTPLTKQEERELAGKRRVAEVNGIGLQIPAGEFEGRNRERVELEAWRRQSKAVELGS